MHIDHVHICWGILEILARHFRLNQLDHISGSNLPNLLVFGRRIVQ